MLLRVPMKLHHVLGSLVLMVAAASSIGCGPGLSHRAKAPTDDLFVKMDAELSNAITTSTTLTGAEMPSSRLPTEEPAVAALEPAVSVTETWATPPPAPAAESVQPLPLEPSPYGERPQPLPLEPSPYN